MSATEKWKTPIPLLVNNSVASSGVRGWPKSYKQLTASQLITGILIQTRHVQHMSCSSVKVLRLWRAHNPLNPSLMRDLIQKLGTRSHPTPRVDRTTMS